MLHEESGGEYSLGGTKRSFGSRVARRADCDSYDGSRFPLILFVLKGVVMILPQVHLRKPCYDFTFL